MTTKKKYVKRSVSFSEDVIKSVGAIAIKEGIAASELIRRYAEQGLNISKSKNVIDFVREQIREELTILLDKRLHWINAMYYRIGSYVNTP